MINNLTLGQAAKKTCPQIKDAMSKMRIGKKGKDKEAGLRHVRGPLLPLPLSHFSRVRLLCDPKDGSPPGSPVPGILQARTLEWVAISFSNA